MAVRLLLFVWTTDGFLWLRLKLKETSLFEIVRSREQVTKYGGRSKSQKGGLRFSRDSRL